jgi:outer membrane protein assembly factor BamB
VRFTTNFDLLALTTVTDTVRVWLMNQIITIEKRNVYGNELIYVVSDHAKAISKLTGKKTIDASDIATLEELGFTVRYK